MTDTPNADPLREAAKKMVEAAVEDMANRYFPVIWQKESAQVRRIVHHKALQAARAVLAADAPEGPSKVEALRAALLGHRADLHGGSKRPCPTCRDSAEALGIDGLVPDCCASARTDNDALNRLAQQGKIDAK